MNSGGFCLGCCLVSFVTFPPLFLLGQPAPFPDRSSWVLISHSQLLNIVVCSFLPDLVWDAQVSAGISFPRRTL